MSYVLSKEEDGEDYEVELDPGEEVSRTIVDYPTQLTPIFMILYWYLSVVFHDKYHSCKYEKHSREICLPDPTITSTRSLDYKMNMSMSGV